MKACHIRVSYKLSEDTTLTSWIKFLDAYFIILWYKNFYYFVTLKKNLFFSSFDKFEKYIVFQNQMKSYSYQHFFSQNRNLMKNYQNFSSPWNAKNFSQIIKHLCVFLHIHTTSRLQVLLICLHKREINILLPKTINLLSDNEYREA